MTMILSIISSFKFSFFVDITYLFIFFLSKAVNLRHTIPSPSLPAPFSLFLSRTMHMEAVCEFPNSLQQFSMSLNPWVLGSYGFLNILMLIFAGPSTFLSKTMIPVGQSVCPVPWVWQVSFLYFLSGWSFNLTLVYFISCSIYCSCIKSFK